MGWPWRASTDRVRHSSDVALRSMSGAPSRSVRARPHRLGTLESAPKPGWGGSSKTYGVQLRALRPLLSWGGCSNDTRPVGVCQGRTLGSTSDNEVPEQTPRPPPWPFDIGHACKGGSSFDTFPRLIVASTPWRRYGAPLPLGEDARFRDSSAVYCWCNSKRTCWIHGRCFACFVLGVAAPMLFVMVSVSMRRQRSRNMLGPSVSYPSGRLAANTQALDLRSVHRDALPRIRLCKLQPGLRLAIGVRRCLMAKVARAFHQP